MTPTPSFKLGRGGDLASGPSSGSPFGGRSGLSGRLATLRESLDHEGEDAETSSEVVTPSAARTLQMSTEGAAFGGRPAEGAELETEAAADAPGDILEENVIPSQASSSSSSSSSRSGKGPSRRPAAEQAPERAKGVASAVAVAVEPVKEKSSAGPAPRAAATQPGREGMCGPVL